MSVYRLYFINRTGGFTDRIEFDAVTDDAAYSKALETSNGHRAELWSFERKLGVVNEEPRHLDQDAKVGLWP